jgi:cell division protein FtsB
LQSTKQKKKNEVKKEVLEFPRRAFKFLKKNHKPNMQTKLTQLDVIGADLTAAEEPTKLHQISHATVVLAQHCQKSRENAANLIRALTQSVQVAKEDASRDEPEELHKDQMKQLSNEKEVIERRIRDLKAETTALQARSATSVSGKENLRLVFFQFVSYNIACAIHMYPFVINPISLFHLFFAFKHSLLLLSTELRSTQRPKSNPRSHLKCNPLFSCTSPSCQSNSHLLLNQPKLLVMSQFPRETMFVRLN